MIKILIGLITSSSLLSMGFKLVASAASSSALSTHDVTLRLYFVRHGQTVANRDGFVAGQAETALTSTGKMQARATGSSWKRMFGKRNLAPQDNQQQHNQQQPSSSSFWRCYSSDQTRAEETAQLIMEQFPNLQQQQLIRDKRLRERAKGVRELRPSATPYDVALREWLEHPETANKPIPLLETEDEVWSRVYLWMNDLLQDAIDFKRNQDNNNNNNNKEGQEEEGQQQPTTTTTTTTNSPLEVLVVSHSGTIKTTLLNLFYDKIFSLMEAFQEGKETKGHKVHATGSGFLLVPNCSVSVFDLIIKGSDGMASTEVQSKLVHLTLVDHLKLLI